MLTAFAFLCAASISSAADCERLAVARAVVGQGALPNGCLIDGYLGAAANGALAADADHRLVVVCRRAMAPD